jgi:diguanylate cyclase (GGDEF)-like protein
MYFVAREISLRYSSENFKRLKWIALLGAALSLIGAILTVVKVTGIQSIEWSVYGAMWIGSLWLRGLPYKSWMLYAIPGSLLVIILSSFIFNAATAGLLVIALSAGSALYSYIVNGKSLKVIPWREGIIFTVFLIADIIYPTAIFRVWEGIVLLYIIISRLIAYLHNIYFKSITDRLTGLYNRKTFVEYVESFIQAQHKVTVLFIDLDDFKKKNDTEGHAAGDLALVNAASLLKKLVEGRGVAGRFGGEELVALVIEDDAVEIAETFRKNLPEFAGVTASIGVAVSDDELDAQGLIAKADDAMYVAKHSGKNKVVS